MIRFISKIFEEISVEGSIELSAKRNFKKLRNFDLEIYQEENLLLSISTSTNFLKLQYEITTNTTGYDIQIESNAKVIIDDKTFELKIDRLYPFKKKYADVYIDNTIVGEIIFQSKCLKIILDFVPNADFTLNSELASKIAYVVLLNIADLDGSE